MNPMIYMEEIGFEFGQPPGQHFCWKKPGETHDFGKALAYHERSHEFVALKVNNKFAKIQYDWQAIVYALLVYCGFKFAQIDYIV